MAKHVLSLNSLQSILEEQFMNVKTRYANTLHAFVVKNTNEQLSFCSVADEVGNLDGSIVKIHGKLISNGFQKMFSLYC